MIVLKRIIGWEAPKDKLPPTDIEDCRPSLCPACSAPAWNNGHIVLVGHGSYKRWVNIPQGIKIRIRRFCCKNCGATCSVLPHWLLPRFQYTAPLILSSLAEYHIEGKTAQAVTAGFSLSDPKHRWGTLRRWGAAFLVSAHLWGWLGASLGVRKDVRWSRQLVRTHLQRFMTRFTDCVLSGPTPHIPSIVRRSLGGMVFSHSRPRSFRPFRRGEVCDKTPYKSRLEVPTQNAGASRAPP